MNTIAYGAFAYCLSLERVTLGTRVRSIEEDAFCGCTKLKEIVVYADRLIEIDENTFSEIEKSDDIIVCVPANRLDEYVSDENWTKLHIQVLEAQTIGSMDEAVSVITTSSSSVNISWQAVPNTWRYVVTLTEKVSGKVICTLTFNQEGYVMSVDYNKSPVRRLPKAIQESGFSFVIEDLDPDMEYEYTLVATDERETVLESQSGTFSTKQVVTGTEDIQPSAAGIRKALRNGVLHIERDGVTYDATGRLVKQAGKRKER